MMARVDEYQQSSWASGVPAAITQSISAGSTIALPIGLSMFQMLGNSTATDQNMVQAILNQVPNFSYTGADIGGTGRTFGGLAQIALSWAPYMSGIELIQKLDAVCLGFKTFEVFSGRPVRMQIYGYPSGTVESTFTEGVDVRSGRGTRSIEQLVNSSYVEGITVPGSNGFAVIFDYVISANDFQPSGQPVVEQYKSELIEAPAGSGDYAAGSTSFGSGLGNFAIGLSPTDVANWRLSERNRELVDITLTTFRDDLLAPGHTYAILSPHMALTEPVWLRRVEIRVSNRPVRFQQTAYGVGGGSLAQQSPALSYSAPQYY
jgi:hypothetical protein